MAREGQRCAGEVVDIEVKSLFVVGRNDEEKTKVKGKVLAWERD